MSQKSKHISGLREMSRLKIGSQIDASFSVEKSFN